MLTTEQQGDRVALIDVDAEFAARFSWWIWAPESERRVFVDALTTGDEDVERALETLGERRVFYREAGTCWSSVPIRMADGEPVLGETDAPLVMRLWGGRSGCVCLIHALLSDALFEHASRPPGASGVSSPRSLLSYVASHLHDDPGFDVERYIARLNERRLARANPHVPACLPLQIHS